MQPLIDALLAIQALEAISVLFGIAYIVLAARENIWCWPAALVGTATAIVLFWDVSLLMESALNGYYLIMALYGWWQWKYGSSDQGKLAITSWGLQPHLIAISLIIVLSLISGYLLNTHTQAALPYVDSFTTWAAVITTWMVAKKILENWLYWIVIDAVSVWLYYERGLLLYAVLFVAYTMIAWLGFNQWRNSYQHAPANA
jgi:nicotinamide mononucleotide transporter